MMVLAVKVLNSEPMAQKATNMTWKHTAES